MTDLRMVSAKCPCGSEWSLDGVIPGETIKCPGCGKEYKTQPNPDASKLTKIAQDHADRRNALREEISSMIALLLTAPRDGPLGASDDPEGNRNIKISHTLALQWARTLERVKGLV